MLTFRKDRIGTSKHLVYDNGVFHWTNENQSSLMALDNSCLSFENIMALFHNDLPQFVPEKYKKAAQTLGIEDPPWYHFMGKDSFRSSIKSYVEAYDRFSMSQSSGLVIPQLKIECMIRRMVPAPYNPEKILPSMIDKFNRKVAPFYKDGIVKPPSYNRTGTVTGRLKVTTGPSVLTMDSRLRAGLIDAFQVDFCSMEPNLLLAYQSRDPHRNLYVRSSVYTSGKKYFQT